MAFIELHIKCIRNESEHIFPVLINTAAITYIEIDTSESEPVIVNLMAAEEQFIVVTENYNEVVTKIKEAEFAEQRVQIEHVETLRLG